MKGAVEGLGGDKWERIARWLLVIAYGIGSPVFVIAEFMTGVFSARFDYPPGFLYFVGVVQFSCAVLLVLKRARLLSLAGLTVMSVGAIYAHFRIGSPFTSIPSLVFTAAQLWYAWQIYRDKYPKA